MADDLSRSVEYFRRAKDRGGDEKLLARGLLHFLKHLQDSSWTELKKGRDIRRAEDLLDKAWKVSGTSSLKKTAEALYLFTKELKDNE